VRLVLGITLILLGLGLLLSQWEGLAALPLASIQETRWVRTADGWERADRWGSSAAGEPALGPLVVAAGQGLFSVFALAAFPGRVRMRQQRAGRNDPPC
jgi:hypothetical protein